MLQSINARTGLAHGAAWAESTSRDIDLAALQARQVARDFAASTTGLRATLLRGIGQRLLFAREALVALADRETGLGLPRLNGELDRTVYQLEQFALALDQGAVHLLLDEPAVAGAAPLGRPRMTRIRVPLGPVAVFAASNFPFAFSVAGGDTASALAAGCPVIVKAHPAHPALSLALAEQVQAAVAQCGLPAAVFQLVQGAGIAVGVTLVQAPAIAAVAFTGSLKAGRALADLAAARPRPIPFFGELGSVNPLIVLPAALASGAAQRAAALAQSITLGAGQFCTSPGVILVPQGEPGDGFVRELAGQLSQMQPHGMLTAGIRQSFESGVQAWCHVRGAQVLAGQAGGSAATPCATLVQVSAADYLAQPALQHEVFGPAALVVRTAALQEMEDVLGAIGGTLTVTLWGIDGDAAQVTDEIQALVRRATDVAGRVLFAGVPTGVAVTAAQQHGGPYPASTAPGTTSVGLAAMDRFLRPVALQDAPDGLIQRLACG
ncbi:aldehyde dehydrogenase (NADP(+)) [Pantoea sp. 18069]|uniref:aldehyde dehydrogenase (NADP(+)) n=1 Tax=Pantoea sp. 18069 TaxID=2681415 RepID=UPI001357267A|nr:aldehyde dehydrogenase (NADP(+)) [Pantoea sp. 18069]